MIAIGTGSAMSMKFSFALVFKSVLFKQFDKARNNSVQ